MLRALTILVCAALVVAAAWAIALLHGHLSFQLGGIIIDTSAPIALVALVVLFVALYVVVRLLGALLRTPVAGAPGANAAIASRATQQ